MNGFASGAGAVKTVERHLMRERWRPVALLTGTLFLVNVLGRVAVKLWAEDNDDRQIKIGLVAFVVVSLISFAVALRWVPRHPMAEMWGDFVVSFTIACALCVLVGPLTVGDNPFDEGAGIFFRQIWWFYGFALGGAGFGALVIMTMGRDWKSQAWKRYAQQARSRPRRVVRR